MKYFIDPFINSFYSFAYSKKIVLMLGVNSYSSYRITAIIKIKNSDLIAFAERRVNHAGDFGKVDMMYKISKHEGQTWEALKIAIEYENLQAGKPASIINFLDP